MKKSEELRNRIEEWEDDLIDLCAMSEEAACDRFNVDSKYEAIELINMELQDAYKALDETEYEEAAEEYAGWADPAFRSIGDFDRMRA
jgi:uncharacterized coiled-coil DUF342 family protein